jgi:biopolymer transport protein ExbD
MAEITTNNSNKGGKRCIKKSTKVDLTPMVDLGFLLITFFVFTTTMSTTTAMGMVTPKEDTTIETEIPESTVITVIPAANDKLYYYEGNESSHLKTTNYSPSGLRKLLLDKKEKVEANGKDAILIIKPSKFSSFKNMVNVIDESKICMYKRYFLDKLDEAGEIKVQ